MKRWQRARRRINSYIIGTKASLYKEGIRTGEDRGVCYMLGRDTYRRGGKINSYPYVGNMYVVQFRQGWMDAKHNRPILGWKDRRLGEGI